MSIFLFFLLLLISYLLNELLIIDVSGRSRRMDGCLTQFGSNSILHVGNFNLT